MSSSNKVALAKLYKRHYHVLHSASHRHRYLLPRCLLSRCLSSVFTKISARKAKQSMAFGLLLLASIFTTPLSAQFGGIDVDICDRTAEVEAAILAAIPSPAPACTAVTSDQLAAITGTLDLSGMSISALQSDDFAGLISLTELDLGDNDLSALPTFIFNSLIGLTELDLGNNRLSALPASVFNNLTNLTELELVGNTFTTPLPTNIFNALPSNATIQIDLSPIGNLAVALDASGMTTIDLSDAFISKDGMGDDRPLSYSAIMSDDTSVATVTTAGSMVTITAVAVGTTEVSVTADDDSGGARADVTRTISVTVEAAMNICDRTAEVESAILAAIPETDDCTAVTATQLAAIDRLDLSNMSISVLQADDFTGLNGLIDLNLESNDLSALNAGVFDNLTNLTDLDLGFNGLSMLPAGVFDNLTNLTALWLNHNRPIILPAGVFDNLTNLTFLNLDGNDLSMLPAGVFDNLSNLDILRLEDNNLSTLPADVFDNLTSLTELDLDDNDFSMLPAGVFDNLTNLTFLDLSANDFSMLPADIFDNLRSLTILSLHNNNLSTLPDDIFDNLTNLAQLYLFDNNLSTLPAGIFDSLRNLFTLSLSGNNLSTLTADVFDTLTNLDNLFLGANNLSTLADNIFDNLTSLTQLDLGDNSLSALPAGVFDNLTNLFTLDLSGNASLNALNADVFSGLTNLSILYLQDNTFTTPLPANLFNDLPDDALIEIDLSPIGDLDGVALTTGGTTTINVASAFISRDADGNDRTTTYSVTSDTDAIATATESSGMITINGIAMGTTNINIVANDGIDDVTRTISTVVETVIDICSRTAQVRDAILAAIPSPAPTCDAVPEAQLAAIDLLDLSGMSIGSLLAGDFDGLSGLTTLRLDDNSLSTLPAGILDDLTNLTTLFFGDILNRSGNSLSMLPAGVFDNLTNLTRLDLYDNNLSTLPAGVFDNLTNLTFLSLSENSLSALPAGVFDNLTSLDYLGLFDNSLSVLNAGVFDNLTNLTFLGLGGNNLSTLPAGIFDNLTNLDSLGLAENDLSALNAGVFDNLRSLTFLSLAHNNLSALNAGVFDNLTNLGSLILGGNSLSTLPMGVFDNLRSLAHLDLTSNGLSALPVGVFDNLTSLTFLNLNANDISALNAGVFDNLTNLDSLSLAGSDLSALPAGVFDNLRSLTLLTLQFNSISMLPDNIFDSLTNLTELDLWGNNISMLSDNVFDNLRSLTRLNLSDNLLSALPVGVFDNLTSLSTLRLRSNTFATPLPANIFNPFPGASIWIDLSPIGDLPDVALTTGTTTTINVASAFISRDIDGNDRTTTYSVTSDADTVATATESSGMITINGIAMGTTNINIVANDGVRFVTRTVAVTVETVIDICSRTAQVRDAILAAIPSPTPTCDAVPEAQLAAITGLNLFGMGITALQADDFASLTDLTTLNLGNNSLSALLPGVFDNLTSLTFLSLSENQISVLPAGIFDNLTNLGFLSFDGNSLTELPAGVFDNLTSLTTLHLYDNNLSALNASVFDNLTSLVTLDLQVNGLSALNAGVFDNLTSLSILSLAGNSLSALPAGIFDNLTNLTFLGLAGTSLSALNAGVFDNLTNLETLDLQVNGLSALNAGVFDNLTNLGFLSLAGNSLTELPAGLFSGLTNLGSPSFISPHFANPGGALRLQNNTFTTPLPANLFNDLPDDALIEIDLSPIGDLPDVALTVGTTTTINVASTFISRDSDGNDRTITYSVTSDADTVATATESSGMITINGIAMGMTNVDITASDGTSMSTRTVAVTVDTVIDICSRTAQVRDAILAAIPSPAPTCDAVPEAQLAAIDRLDLSNMSIGSLLSGDFDGLSGLTTLVLGDNALSTLPANIFNPLTALTTLDLANNSLNALESNVFSSLTNLEGLTLQNNSLIDLPTGLFSGLTSLNTLRLQGNTFIIPLLANLFDDLPSTALIEIDLSPIGDLQNIPSLNFGDTATIDVSGAFISRDADGNDRPLTYTATPATPTIASVSLSGATGTITAGNTHGGTDVSITANDGINNVTRTVSVTVLDTVVNICNRTPQVESAILAVIPVVTPPACDAVTATQLAGITSTLDLSGAGISALQADDFAGLTGLTILSLSNNSISTLPAGLFSDLRSLTFLNLSGNTISTPLPDNLFDSLTSLTFLDLNDNDLSALPDNVFDNIRGLTFLGLNDNDLSALPVGVFDNLMSLTELGLSGSDLSTLPAGVFDSLTNLRILSLGDNSLNALESNVFSTLRGLTTLSLDGNALSALPAGLFSRLTMLDTLYLQGNTFTTPLPADIFDPLPDSATIQIDLSPIGQLGGVVLAVSGTATVDVTAAFISRDGAGSDRNLSFNATPADSAIVTTSVNRAMVSINGVALGSTTVSVIANDGGVSTAVMRDLSVEVIEAGILAFDDITVGSAINTVTIEEARGSDILYMQLASQPAANVIIRITSNNIGEGTVSPSALTFTSANWDSRQALTVTAVDDNIDRDDSFMMDFVITTGDGSAYMPSLALPSRVVFVTDDDTASTNISLSVSPTTVAETAGTTLITVTATLDGAASATNTEVTITVGGGTATETSDYTLSLPTATLTIPATMTSGTQTFTIDPVDDSVNDNGETIIIDGVATINGITATINAATLTIVEFSEEDQRATEQTVAAQVSGVTQVVTEQIGVRLVSRAPTSSGSSGSGGGGGIEPDSLTSIDWQNRLAKFTYEGLQRLDNEADIMSLDWLLKAAGGNGQVLMPLGAEALTLWATGGGISTKGDGVADYDGNVRSFILGIDTALANDWVVGVAVSYNESEVDYTMDGNREGETQQTTYSIHPYLSHTLTEGLTLWMAGGYGFGDIDFSHTTHGQATNDTTQWMAAGGVEKQIITDSPWQGALRLKGLWGNAIVDATTYDGGATISKIDTKFWRARMESELSYNFSLPGANIRPYAIVGGRWDHNDAIVSGDEWHVDVGGGVELSDNDLALDISVHTQLTEGDTEEHAIVATGSLTYDLEQDRQGLQITLSRPLDNTSPAFNSHSFNEVTDTASGLSAAPLTSELAYGWTVHPFGLEGAIQTYIQNSFDSSDRHYAVGLELVVNALTLNFESGYHTNLDSEARGTGLESMLKTKIRW